MKFIVFMSVLVLLVGCANQLPKGEVFPETSQKKALMANHWSLIAEDAAQRTRIALANQGISGETPIFVAEGAKHDFDRAFRKYLISHLIENGATVVTIPKGAIEVKYESQIIRHGSAIDLQTYGYKPGMLVAGVASFWVLRDVFRVGRSSETIGWGALGLAGAKELYDSKYAGETPIELILTTSATNQNKYLMLNADAYYIEKGEEFLFQECTNKRRCREVK